MENCKRTGSTDLKWLLALCAAAGTFLMAFAPGGAWLNGAQTPGEQLLAALAKQLLTILLMLIVPALWARLAHRTTPWILLGLAAFAYGCGALLLKNAADALYTVLLIALPGAGLYFLQRYRLSNFRTVLYETFLILIALFGYVCLRDLIRSGDAYLSVKGLIGLYEQALETMDFGTSDPTGGQLVSLIKETVRSYKLSPETVCVPLMLTQAMVCSLSVTLFSHLLNRRGGAPLSALPPFREWRCERWYVLLAAGFMVVTLLMQLFGTQNGNALAAVAEPLWRLPCALAGLSAVRSLSLQARKGWIFWVIVAMVFVLPTMTMLLLTAIGMLSSLRRPINVGEDGIRK